MEKRSNGARAWSEPARLICAMSAVLLIGALGTAALAVAEGTGESEQPQDKASANVLVAHQELGIDLEKVAQDARAALPADATPAEQSAAKLGTREFCLSCHDWDSVVDSTVLPGDVSVYNKRGIYNVHDNHNGLVDCSDCHKVDGTASTLGCVRCHYMELPDGWEGFY